MTSYAAPSTSRTNLTTSYSSYTRGDETTNSRPRDGRSRAGGSTAARPRTAASTIAGAERQQLVCAINESRGTAPTVGLALVNLVTSEAVLCQICDSQTYVRTIQKLCVYGPSEILVANSQTRSKSKLLPIIEEAAEELGSKVIGVDRSYFAEDSGQDWIRNLAFPEDLEAIKISVEGNFFAVCCMAAVCFKTITIFYVRSALDVSFSLEWQAMKYIEVALGKTFAPRSLRIRHEPSEGSMMIDVSTTRSLELIQNLQNSKSKDCLFGLLNETLTSMGSRYLRSNILQPLTDVETLELRYDALEELTTKEEMFFATRQALKSFLDADKLLTALIVVPANQSLFATEQAVNDVLRLKQFVESVEPIYEALTGATSHMLANIRLICTPGNVRLVKELISEVINEDTTFSTAPLDLRNQRAYAVKAGVNGLLDIARQTYSEASSDACQHVKELGETHKITLDIKFDNVRQFYIRIPATETEDNPLPDVFINCFRKKKVTECQTLELVKINQKVIDSHNEVLLMSSRTVEKLIQRVREHAAVLFKISESVAMLDMFASFAHVVTTQDYVRPKLKNVVAVKSGRHPIREKIHVARYVPNDVYAAEQSRFQIITGANMSGKSTYIRSIALMAVMVQIGSFVPAQYASFPICHQLFARVNLDDCVEANVSTFTAEMRDMAFILRNVDYRSLVVIDELGRGTSTRDGMAIALAIAEALVGYKAFTWFATHFRDISRIMAARPGVISFHLATEMTRSDELQMTYRIADGAVAPMQYGLAIARTVPLPHALLQRAEDVAKVLEESQQRRKNSSVAVVQQKQRKLVLGLREQLILARNGEMRGEALKLWLKKLQEEFVNRMSDIEEAEDRNFGDDAGES